MGRNQCARPARRTKARSDFRRRHWRLQPVDGARQIGTLARLKASRAIIDGLTVAHRGRIFNTAGDSVVADFASAVDAVQCAVAVQTAIAKENASEPGDGVNIAARMESLAAPGAVCVSAAAREHVGNNNWPNSRIAELLPWAWTAEAP